MCHVWSQWLKFHEILFEADLAARDRVRSAGCLYDCGGRLDVANYPRKARGLDDAAEHAGHYDVRLSLCCSRDGCRRRVTPPSVRFLGRRVFVAVLVIVSSMMTAETLESLPPASPSPSRQTRGRWRSFWREKLATSAMYIELIGSRMSPALDPRSLPDAMLDRFEGELEVRLESMLRMLSPWTTISVPPESARSVMVR